jgi:hypothetical protein
MACFASTSTRNGPWCCTSVPPLGVLGRSFRFEGQGSISIELDRFELYAGYSTWVIGQTVLQGPLAGVRVTF